MSHANSCGDAYLSLDAGSELRSSSVIIATVWHRHSETTGPALLVGHAGGAAIADGDPLIGVQRLIQAGVDMVEVDVRTTKDAVLVVHHDASFDGLLLQERTYDELTRSNARLPTFEAFLDAASTKIALDVELKEPGYEAAVLSAVLAHTEPERIFVTSFHETVIQAVKLLAPTVATGLLVGRLEGWRTPLYALRDIFPFTRLQRCRADFLAPNRRLLPTGLAHRAERRGLRLLVWGVSDPGEVARLRADPRVLGVVTDSVELLSGP